MLENSTEILSNFAILSLSNIIKQLEFKLFLELLLYYINSNSFETY